MQLTGLFCGDIGLFCRDNGLFCGNIWLFCGDIGLFFEYLLALCSLARALCPRGGLYIRLLKIIGLFCKRALQKRPIFCQAIPTNQCFMHPSASLVPPRRLISLYTHTNTCVCMYIYIHVHTHPHTHAQIHAHTHKYTRTQTHTYTNTPAPT